MCNRIVLRWYVKRRLKQLSLTKREIRVVMANVRRGNYYRAAGSCPHCHRPVYGRYQEGEEMPLGSAAIIGKKTNIHKGFFCINCGMELMCSVVDIGKPIADNDFYLLQYGAWFSHGLQIREGEAARNLFALLRQEATLPEADELEALVGEREQLMARLKEVEEKIAALEGADGVLDELKALEQPVELAATNN